MVTTPRFRSSQGNSLPISPVLSKSSMQAAQQEARSLCETQG